MAATTTTQDQLLRWYAMRQPFRINLVGDYAGSTPFLIDGDSLLRHIFADPRVDFSTGFQLVHAVYAVEHFLEDLRRRNCVFDVLFFEAHRHICVPAWNSQAAWKYDFARGVILKHLSALKRDGDPFVEGFASVEDPTFAGWLDKKRPLFVMAHDGEDILVHRGDGKEEEGAAVEGTAKDWEVKAMIYKFMHIGRGYNVALINSVSFEDSKVLSVVIEAGLRSADIEIGAHAIDISAISGAAVRLPKVTLPKLDITLPKSLSDRELLTAHTLARLFRADDSSDQFASMASVYLLHTAFLNHLTIEERHFRAPAEALQQVKGKACVDTFLRRFFAEAAKVIEAGVLGLNETALLADFVDGRLLLKLLMQKVDVTKAVSESFAKLANAVEVGSAKDVKLVLASPLLGTAGATVETTDDHTASAPVLPFHNPMFNLHLRTIDVGVEILPNDNEFDAHVISEQYRPNRPKKPFKEQAKPTAPVNGGYRAEKKPMLNKGGRYAFVDPVERRAIGKVRKKDQVNMAQMTRYAASLTDSNDGSLNQKLIICDEGGTTVKKQVEKRPAKGAKKEEAPTPTPASGKQAKPVKGGKKEAAKKDAGKKDAGKKDAGKKAPALSKADKIKLENAEKAVAKEAKALQTSWKNLCNELKVTKDEDLIISRLDDHIKKLARDVPKKAAAEHEGRFIEVEVRLYKIWTLQRLWISLCKAGKKEKGYNTIAVLFDEARKTLQSPALTTAVKTCIQNVFAGLDIALPPANPTVAVKRAISFTTWTGKVDDEDLKLGMSSEEFQLLYFGPYMDRNMDSAPDDRVSFEPDGWQRKVLDEIDADNSVFVVAPTSAGKTFISFHAMEKILKADDSSVLVYIAPTKALVNQIAAEVISRFRKNYRHAGKTVWAIHNGDFWINEPKNCQILITVPAILSSMLFSPEIAKSWAPRVKRIIFDEIHSIGNAEDGVIWEQLLLVSPCPIIALSATVGNPDEFSDWLKATQNSLGIKLSMIQHPYRYSDLRKYIYQPAANVGIEKFPGLPRLYKYGQIDEAIGLDVIHPVSALIDPIHGLPDDLALEPSDLLRLYQAMKRVETAGYLVPAEVDYKKVFGTSGLVIKKADTIAWEVQLKAVLKKWMQEANKSPFSKLVSMLQIRELEYKIDPLAAAEEVKREAIPDDTKLVNKVYEESDVATLVYLKQKTLPLLASLHAANSLPALMFSYDRSMCEYICLNLARQLKEAEDHFRATDPRWKQKIKDWEAYVERKKKMGNKMRKVKPEEGATKADLVRDAAESEASMLDSFNPEDPSPEFSFADWKRYSQAEWEQDLKDFERWEVAEELVEAFKRGIGVHHAGLGRKYRQHVETLFRKGYLRVIIATGGLAMGINMPCKTVIFAGNNTELTALNYRQAAGRAGRRGFDLLGNVIFHGLPLDSAYRLMASRLPKLQGHFPMSTSLVLRLCILLSISKDSEHARTTIDTLLRQPRLVLGGESNSQQVLYHLRFSIEFLRRKKLLGARGESLGFASMVGHLFTERAAFALHALLVDGYLPRLCAGFSTMNTKAREEVCEEFMYTLAWLFIRRPVNRAQTGIRTLPPFPEAAKKVLDVWNQEMLTTYSTYVNTFAKQFCKDRDNVLPFSHQAVGGNAKTTALSAPASARSPFVALSGAGKKFADMYDLSTSLRRGVFFEAAAVPHVDVGDSVRLNSFLVDFWKHGDTLRLARENAIAAGDVWYVLKDFSVVLSMMAKGLAVWRKEGAGAYFEVGERSGELEAEEEEEDEWDMGGIWEVAAVLRECRVRFEEKFKAMWA